MNIIVLLALLTGSWLAGPSSALAVEEGQFVKKEGKWEYYSGEDPGLKYLYLKGIITQEEYDKGLKVIENKERVSKTELRHRRQQWLKLPRGRKVLFETPAPQPGTV